MNTNVDLYFVDGCGRCPLGGTPECKVHRWAEELRELREIILQSELNEESKWGVPCYTLDGKNVLILSAFKDFCSINFFKGVLIKDSYNVLDKPGPNSQSARLLKFTSPDQVEQKRDIIREYVKEAIEIEKSGRKVDFNAKHDLEFPEELIAKFEEDPTFESAFQALTPGRQRGYIIHFSAAKQSKTKTNRIEKFMPKIFEGKGWSDR